MHAIMEIIQALLKDYNSTYSTFKVQTDIISKVPNKCPGGTVHIYLSIYIPY